MLALGPVSPGTERLQLALLTEKWPDRCGYWKGAIAAFPGLVSLRRTRTRSQQDFNWTKFPLMRPDSGRDWALQSSGTIRA